MYKENVVSGVVG